MLTRADIIPALPKWQEVETLVTQGQSVLLHAPRFYGKRQFVRTLGQTLGRNGNAAVLHLTSSSATPFRIFDFSALWKSVAAQLGQKTRPIADSAHAFEVALRALLEKSQKRIYVTLAGCGRGNEFRHNEMVGIFNNLLLENAIHQRNALCVIALDDYSLFHYLLGRNESDTAYFEKVYVPSLSLEEIRDTQRTLCEKLVDTTFQPVIAETIWNLTGGHVGLALDLLAFALGGPCDTDENSRLDSKLRDRVWSTSVIEGLSAALQQDPQSLSHTALEYVTPRSAEATNPRVHILRELGILIRDWPSSNLLLCPGAITDLVKNVARGPFDTLHRIGSVAAEVGPRIFEDDNVELTDDDFVVVCISDLHINEAQYRFTLPKSRDALNLDKTSLTQLLLDDLGELEVSHRVDLLIIAGDIAGTGKGEEYDCAESVITDLMRELKLDVTRIVIIPGNHDVDWEPGKLAVIEPNRSVSKGNFARFLRLLRKEVQDDVDMVTVRSRSGKKELTVVGFDSNEAEGPGAPGIGYVKTASFDSAQRRLQLARSEAEDAYIWLVVHHHVFAASNARLPDAEKRKVSVLANSAELQSRAMRWSAELIIHGHEHQPSVTIVRTWPVDGDHAFAPLIVVGAGSAGAQRDLLGEFSRNQYFVIYRREQDVIVRSRFMGDHGTNFVAHDDLIVPATGKSKARAVAEKTA